MFSFIVNPAAGKGKAKQLVPWLEAEVRRRGLQAEILVTNGRGAGTELAQQAQGEILVAVGGDGTINEIVNGMKYSKKSLGFLPAGSGNDLISSLEIPKTPALALDVLEARRTRRIDLGSISWQQSDWNGQYGEKLFANGDVICIDAVVASRVAGISFGSGIIVYAIAVLQSLVKYVPWKLHGSMNRKSFESECLLLAVGNGKSAGGGFLLTPNARLDDGHLDICILASRGMFGILTIMPKVIRGRHGSADGAIHQSCKQIEVRCEDGIPIHADGEVLDKGSKHAIVKVLENKLSVIAP